MSAPTRAANWKLRHEVAGDTQGLVVSGFAALNHGRALLLDIGDAAPGGGWLKAIAAVAPVTNADPPERGDAPRRSAALALSAVALARIGLDDAALASFSRPFREGMFQEDRLRRLGDRRGGAWHSTVIEGGPLWSANLPLRAPAARTRGGFDVADGAPPEQQIATPLSGHALLLLYAADEEDGRQWCVGVEEALRSVGVAIAHQRALFVDARRETNISHEHFGFADGLSQPQPYDVGGAVLRSGAAVTEPQAVQGVPLGDFLFGHVNAYGEVALGPVVSAEALGSAAPSRLAAAANAEGFFDLGRNGSYLIVRELAQDVAAFWLSMDRNAERIRAQDPQNAVHVTAEWIAERAVGRDKAGNLLCPSGTLPLVDGAPDSDYLFWDRDRFGHGCPIGSHVRRAHPRDALSPDAASRCELLKAANHHRILRRGRKYGPPIKDDRADDGVERGLFFMCLNTDIARQFEFVQQTWLLNSSFGTLYGEQDPLVGAPGAMTIRERPLRRIVQVETYVQLIGGDYYFLPSLSALRYLETL